MWKQQNQSMILYFIISKTDSKITTLSNSKITSFMILNEGGNTPIYTRAIITNS
jgi:hypothetical protein